MFGASDHTLGISNVLAMKTADTGGANDRAQIGIFTSALHDSSPARIACDVEHGRERPFQSCGRSFLSCDALRLLDHLRIEAAGASQRDRKHSAKAVNDVITQNQGNLEA